MADTCENNLESIKTNTANTKKEVVNLKSKVGDLETKLIETNKRLEDVSIILKSFHDSFVGSNLNLNYDY